MMLSQIAVETRRRGMLRQRTSAVDNPMTRLRHERSNPHGMRDECPHRATHSCRATTRGSIASLAPRGYACSDVKTASYRRVRAQLASALIIRVHSASLTSRDRDAQDDEKGRRTSDHSGQHRKNNEVNERGCSRDVLRWHVHQRPPLDDSLTHWCMRALLLANRSHIASTSAPHIRERSQ
jgi:hypothetical protein